MAGDIFASEIRGFALINEAYFQRACFQTVHTCERSSNEDLAACLQDLGVARSFKIFENL